MSDSGLAIETYPETWARFLRRTAEEGCQFCGEREDWATCGETQRRTERDYQDVFSCGSCGAEVSRPDIGRLRFEMHEAAREATWQVHVGGEMVNPDDCSDSIEVAAAIADERHNETDEVTILLNR